MELFLENHGQYIKNFVIKLIFIQSCTFRHFTKKNCKAIPPHFFVETLSQTLLYQFFSGKTDQRWTIFYLNLDFHSFSYPFLYEVNKCVIWSSLFIEVLVFLREPIHCGEKMLQYVMTKLETHNINSDGQIMPNSLQNVS